MSNQKHHLKASFVIPSRNEEKNIENTVGELVRVLEPNEIPYELILVNDNSSDGTPQVIQRLMAENPHIRTIDRTPPGGFGRAIRSGLDLVTGDLVIIYMADQSDDPQDALRYYAKIEEGYDCVFGSRFRHGSKVSKYPIVKLVANRIVNRMVQFLFWSRFNDLTNAFKAYRTHVIEECGPYRASHFNITIEMSLSALIRNYNIIEIPIAWYGRTWGMSSLSIGQMGRRYLATLLKVWADRLFIQDDLMAERLAHRIQHERPSEALERRIQTLEAQMASLLDAGKDTQQGE